MVKPPTTEPSTTTMPMMRETIKAVRAASPIRTFSDTTAAHTIGYSSNGSSSHMTTLAVIEEGGVKAKATATGDQANTLTQVLSGQIDIGFGVPPFGLRELDEGKIRIIGTGNEAPSLRDASGPIHR